MKKVCKKVEKRDLITTAIIKAPIRVLNYHKLYKPIFCIHIEIVTNATAYFFHQKEK